MIGSLHDAADSEEAVTGAGVAQEEGAAGAPEPASPPAFQNLVEGLVAVVDEMELISKLTDRTAALVLVGLLFILQPPAPADSTIIDGNEFAWAASIGWINFRPDEPADPDGAVIGETFCSGLIWSANCDWVNLGDGSPANGVRYANTDGVDFGVNHDGTGLLTGLAWGASIGWINFGRDYDEAIPPPRVDLLTGELSGFAWSASCGWIDLGENGTDVLITGQLKLIDSDEDTIDDGWERERLEAAGKPLDLALLGSTLLADADGDLQTDRDEYLSDSDPFDPTDLLRVVSYRRDPFAMLSVIQWKSSDRRAYDLDRSGDLGDWALELSLLGSSGEDTTTVELPRDPAALAREFHRVRAMRPLGGE